MSVILSGTGYVTSNLVLYLDATRPDSYPKQGTVWYDLSGQGNNFNINASAFNPGYGSSPPYMDFNGSYGCAKNGSDISLSDTTNGGVTYVVATRILNSTGNWRTLTRSYVNDHHVIIQSGGWNIGMYDNDSVGFIDSGYSQQSLPGYNTSFQWNILYFRWASDNSFKISYNDSPGTIRGSFSNANGRYNRGFGALGAYHNGDTNVNNASQFWGDISMFMAYNRVLSDAELLQNYNTFAAKYNLTPSTSSGITLNDSTTLTSAPFDSGSLISIVSFTSSGTWTRPSGCTQVIVKIVGAGGGACGYCESGGAGGYSEGLFDVSGVPSVSVTVGSGGSNSGYYSGSGSGSASSFGSYLSASGGYGANNNYSHSGGHGGVGSGGQVNLQGGAGSGHTNSSGSNTQGRGGWSYFGGGCAMVRNHGNLGSFYGPLFAGAPGAGGPGAMTDGAGIQQGGRGESGIVIVYAYK